MDNRRYRDWRLFIADPTAGFLEALREVTTGWEVVPRAVERRNPGEIVVDIRLGEHRNAWLNQIELDVFNAIRHAYPINWNRAHPPVNVGIYGQLFEHNERFDTDSDDDLFGDEHLYEDEFELAQAGTYLDGEWLADDDVDAYVMQRAGIFGNYFGHGGNLPPAA